MESKSLNRIVKLLIEEKRTTSQDRSPEIEIPVYSSHD